MVLNFSYWTQRISAFLRIRYNPVYKKIMKFMYCVMYKINQFVKPSPLLLPQSYHELLLHHTALNL